MTQSHFLDDPTEASEYGFEDYKQVKKEQWNHPEKSIVSLKALARVLRASYPDPSHYVTQQLPAALEWFEAHRDQLPPESVHESSRVEVLGMHDASYGNELVNGSEYFEATEARSIMRTFDYADWGQMNVSGSGCYRSVEEVLDVAISDPDELAALKSQGPYTWESMRVALDIRADRYRRYAKRQQQQLRWRGMQEYAAVTWAQEWLAAGNRYKHVVSGAGELPTVERLSQLLAYDADTGEFVWRVSRGRVKAGTPAYTVQKNGKLRTRIEGKDYITGRLVYKLHTGVDPCERVIDYRDGNRGNLRFDNLNVGLSADSGVYPDPTGGYRVVLYNDNQWHKVGVFADQTTAQRAYELCLRVVQTHHA